MCGTNTLAYVLYARQLGNHTHELLMELLPIHAQTFHSHLCSGEVAGYLGGRYSAESKSKCGVTV